MKKLIECVPNFSEGKNKEIIESIVNEIRGVSGVNLLDVDPGEEMNRTVVTFIGEPEAVKKAAFLSIKKASELIDMSKHKGSHPRMGATDVCPLIPVTGVTTEECILISKELAEMVGKFLNIPVYLYEKSATKPDRSNLAIIRQGEYEGLSKKILLPEWQPDYGPNEFNSKSGATVIGVREFLIAYNINLNTKEKKYADDIALELREKGRSVKQPAGKPYYFKGGKILKYQSGIYPCGDCDYIGSSIYETVEHCKTMHGYDLHSLLKQNSIDVEKPEGKPVKKPGKFSNCKAIGWYVPEYGRAQISINLTNYKITSMHEVLEETRKLASERGLIVTGSEIVGMVPYDALIDSGKFYLKFQERSTGIPISDILETAVQSLGLQDIANFNIKERVLGLPDFESSELVSKKLFQFVDEVSRETPAPGGGSIAAFSGSLGAALISMVANLSSFRENTKESDLILSDSAERCQILKDKLLKAVDDDTNAFNKFIEAKKMVAKTEEEKSQKAMAMQNGLKEAVLVPFNTIKLSLEVLKEINIVLEYGKKASITDLGVAAEMAFSAVKGGIYNVLINLKDIEDSNYNNEIKEKCKVIEDESKEILISVRTKLESILYN